MACIGFRLYGKVCATYESASTRRFLLGRVDCIRAATSEAMEWAAAMYNHVPDGRRPRSSADMIVSLAIAYIYNKKKKRFEKYRNIQNFPSPFQNESKLELFHKAIKKQTEIITENITGHGIDIHLLGLRQAAKDYFLNADIFEDEAYTIANHFSLSTSQVNVD